MKIDWFWKLFFLGLFCSLLSIAFSMLAGHGLGFYIFPGIIFSFFILIIWRNKKLKDKGSFTWILLCIFAQFLAAIISTSGDYIFWDLVPGVTFSRGIVGTLVGTFIMIGGFGGFAYLNGIRINIGKLITCIFLGVVLILISLYFLQLIYGANNEEVFREYKRSLLSKTIKVTLIHPIYWSIYGVLFYNTGMIMYLGYLIHKEMDKIKNRKM